MLLLQRGGERLDRVISQLEADARKAPGEANPLVDLAAAQLTVGWSQGSAGRFVDALESADRALEIEPASSRACFNRAFALEELGLRDLARAGWKDCERLEPDPEWRDEARQRAEKLRIRPAPTREQSAAALDAALRRGRPDELARWARERPHQASYLVICDLLPRWVEAGPLDEAAGWHSLERLAEEVRASTGDRLLFNAVREMRIALAQQRGREIAEGIRGLREGLEAYRNGAYQKAAVRLRESEPGLRRVPALGMVARTYGAVLLYAAKRKDAAEEELTRLLAEAQERSCSWPLGYAHWTLGRIRMSEGHPLIALEHYRQAVRVFERIRAEDLVLSVGMMMAEVYDNLGQPDPAWDFARKALLAAQRLGDPGRLFFVLNVLAGMADDQGRTGFALYAQTSAIEQGAGVSARLRANAHLWRACYYSARKEPDRAQEDLRQAEALAREVTDGVESAQLEAELDLARGVLASRTDPGAAVAELEEAVRLFEQTGNRVNRLSALEARAAALRSLKRPAAAAADLEEAMASYDATARGLAEAEAEPDRLSYLERNAAIYRELVDLHVRELASPWKALVLAEHEKELRAPGRLPRLDLARDAVGRWQRALPAGTALLSYGRAGEGLVAWVLTSASRERVLLGSAAEVADLTGRLGRAPDAETWEGISRELHARLLDPLREPLRGVERILIVPCPGLDRVPFAGLLDPRSGRYLAESYLLEMLPSASALLRRDGPSGAREEQRRNLVVGDPGPTKAALLGLGPLRFAQREAEDAADALGRSTTVLLLGADATPARFREEAVGARVIHVAGHALGGPDSAALVLATGDGDEEGLLTAKDVLRLPLSGTELVILSACSSAGGPAVSWQSGLTLGRSFLSAGAERVVATLHAVDDEESAWLFEGFYRALANGMDAAASLRSAQLGVLGRRSGAEIWTPPSWPYVIILDSRPSNGSERGK